jgi:hypothetical protein
MSSIIARIFSCLSVIKNRWYTWGEGAFATLLVLYLMGLLSAGDSLPWRVGLSILAVVVWGAIARFLPRERRY